MLSGYADSVSRTSPLLVRIACAELLANSFSFFLFFVVDRVPSISNLSQSALSSAASVMVFAVRALQDMLMDYFSSSVFRLRRTP